jgi:hypothetical protein
MRTALIAHRRRPSVSQAVDSLLTSGLIDAVVISSSGADDDLAHLAALDGVTVLHSDAAQFCKSSLLNRGLRTIDGGTVLIADADVIWSSEGLRRVIDVVDRQRTDFCWLAQVEESSPAGMPENRTRLGFRVARDTAGARVEIFEEPVSASVRPGYGMIYGALESFRVVGGYTDDWGGRWGWEDVDFLLRCQLLGFSARSAGWATHLSHGDDVRSLSGTSKEQSRDANLASSRADILAGRLQGPLATTVVAVHSQIRWIENGVEAFVSTDS